MRYAWDSAKDAANRRKHGFSLAEAIPALEDPYRDVWVDDRFDYDEERFINLGLSPRGVLYAVYTEQAEDEIGIISARKAEAHEIERYGHGRT
ncbi:MAG TPA: BrnT family toxin [Terracidiphilus sp.]|jgi:hypothetical protein|nr:BrnT family toxin [Terracidiphilus sp.]